MSDYIKDLNIIDFLGIIVPGCVLVLLVAGDYTALLLWPDYFGNDATTFVKGLFLLIAGYLAGMMLHELGDLVEKGTWCLTRLDPKAYAAYAVGAEKIEEAMHKTGILDKKDNASAPDSVFAPGFKGVLGTISFGLILFFSTVGFCQALGRACQQCTPMLQCGIPARSYVIATAMLLVCMGVLGVMGVMLEKKTVSATCSEKRNVWTILKNVCNSNPQIQTYVAGKGIHNKQNMFDSFRHVMRNLTICIAIVNAYSIWKPVDMYVDFVKHFGMSQNAQWDFFWLTFWFVFVVLVLFARYVHFVFLRYKYSYENFVRHANTNEEDKKEKSQKIHLHIEYANTGKNSLTH